MWKRSFAAGAIVAVAALLLAVETANAQRRWGVSVGGGGVGVYYGSGARYGYGYPGYWNYGSGWNPYSYGAYPYGSGVSLSFGNRPYYGYPYSGGYGYPSYGYQYAYPSSNFGYSTSYSGPNYYSAAPLMSGYQSFYNPSASQGFTPPANSVMVEVRVPDPNAELWFGDTKMSMTGTERSFVSPSLTPGQEYTYTLRAHWTENGEARDRTKTVDVRPGQRVTVDFTQAGSAEQIGRPRSDIRDATPKPNPDLKDDFRPRPDKPENATKPKPPDRIKD